MISILPGRPSEWKASASASENLTLLPSLTGRSPLFWAGCRTGAVTGASQSLIAAGMAARANPDTNPAATPMMVQYLALKAEVEDCLLFYRMGDFFELFFEDARVAAACLDIALTARGEHDGKPIPMCGVPIHAAESYLARLIRAGHRVAIAEQTESPAEAKKRGSKSVVSRAIVR